jgi:hypothetical protein
MAELIYNKPDSEAYKNFINSLDSPVSREDYSQVFPYFMKFCQVTSYEDMLLIDIKKLEGLIRDYIIYLKQVRKLAPATVSCYVAAITHFYQMNDVIINWKKLNKFKGRLKTIVEDKPYTRTQIKTLVDGAASVRMRTADLTSLLS